MSPLKLRDSRRLPGDTVKQFLGNFRRRNRYLLCRCAMLCRPIGALASESDTARFELPILRAGFQTTDYYSVADLLSPFQSSMSFSGCS
jgi:hypothetical protein